MMKFLSAGLLAFILFAAHSASASNAPSPFGYWLTENERAVIKLKPCDEDKLCGYIHWIIDGGMQIDENNPDESLRDRPMCELVVMWGLEQDEDDPEEWENGTIYKADDGDFYDADIELEDENTMELTGYLGITLFGKTQTWTRVSPDDYPSCQNSK